jgi:hypothetical protein
MSLSSYLARPLRWLRAGYPPGAPRHGYVPLIALMPGPATQVRDAPGAAEQPALGTAPHPAGRRGGGEDETAARQAAQAQGLAVTEMRGAASPVQLTGQRPRGGTDGRIRNS